MREFRSYGSVRGVLGNQHSYRDQLADHLPFDTPALLYIRANGLFTKRVTASKTVRADV